VSKFKFLSEGDEVLEQTLAYTPPVPQDLRDEDVLAAFQKIPEVYREAVLLSDVYELSYKEIRETLDIPIGTVMSRLSRGRQLLKIQLADVAGAAGYQSTAVGIARAV
jgi:DNA-directed RNA polymerase specialized sigma24 family protein